MLTFARARSRMFVVEERLQYRVRERLESGLY